MLSMSIHHRRGEGLPWVLCILARHAKYPTGAAYIVIKAERERERERERDAPVGNGENNSVPTRHRKRITWKSERTLVHGEST